MSYQNQFQNQNNVYTYQNANYVNNNQMNQNYNYQSINVNANNYPNSNFYNNMNNQTYNVLIQIKINIIQIKINIINHKKIVLVILKQFIRQHVQIV